MTTLTAAPATGRLTTQTFSAVLRGHRNSLGLIRLVLAAVVIFDHAFPLGGFGTDFLWYHTRGQASMGSIAVYGFFAISGYLIAKSGTGADVVQFLWRRVLRIFPAYWTVLLLTAFVIAPIFWVLAGHTLHGFFSFGGNGPFHYFTANWTLNIGTYGVNDIFLNTTPYGRSVHGAVFNGSIWTLIYEWKAYLIIAGMVVFGVLKRAKVLVPLLAGFFLILEFVTITNPSGLNAVAPFFSDAQLIPLTFTFLLGSTIAIYADKIVCSDAFGVLAGLLMLVTLRYGGFSTLGLIAGTYFILYLSVRLPAALQRVGAKNDYSYGVYIYGFLVQQCLAFFGLYKLGYLPFALIALVISLGCAWLSWHGIEKWAMSLKSWGPGLGLSYWYQRVRSPATRRETARPHATSGGFVPEQTAADEGRA